MTPVAVTLRSVSEADVEVFLEHQLDPEANRMAAFPARQRSEHTAHWRRILADETVVARTVVHDGRVAGNVVSWVQDGHREVGYWLGREHWGGGIASLALEQLIGVVDDRPLFAYVAVHNAGSARVLEKCGFVLDGELEEGAVRRLVYVLS